MTTIEVQLSKTKLILLITLLAMSVLTQAQSPIACLARIYPRFLGTSSGSTTVQQIDYLSDDVVAAGITSDSSFVGSASLT